MAVLAVADSAAEITNKGGLIVCFVFINGWLPMR